jgi:hypothetical protein
MAGLQSALTRFGAATGTSLSLWSIYMRSFLSMLSGWLRRSPPRLRCQKRIWDAGVRELGRRTLNERRESGAFLLGRPLRDGSKQILDFIFYDDIDAQALSTGIVTIRETALPKLWEICRSRGYGVVADVHVHPGGYGQSSSDRENPVMPRSGHIALILPNFARGQPRPGSIGMYEFLGSGNWVEHSALGHRFFRLEGFL